VRYALMLSLDVAETVDVDLYTPIATQIAVPVAIAKPNTVNRKVFISVATHQSSWSSDPKQPGRCQLEGSGDGPSHLGRKGEERHAMATNSARRCATPPMGPDPPEGARQQ
jgi:hypothetical protein